VQGRSTAWDNTVVYVEDKVSIEHFFLIPVVRSEFGTFLPGIINLESGKGDWSNFYYHPRYATNLIETNKKNSSFSCKANIPAAAYYQSWFSVLSLMDNSLELGIENELDKHKINIKLNGDNKWLLIPIEPIYLNKGTHSIVLKNLCPHKVSMDFFILLPRLELEGSNRLINRQVFTFDEK